MKTCKTCKFWGVQDPFPCERITDSQGCGPAPQDSAYVWDYEGYSAGMCTGPDFSCSLWEEKDEDLQS